MTTTIEDDGLRAIDTDEIAAVLFAQRQTPYVWADAIDAPSESDEGTLVSICRDDAAAVLAALRSSPAVDGVGEPWQDIATARRDGTHLLVKFEGTMSPPTVAHWFGTPDDGGWFLSVQQLAGPAIHPTHWMPVPGDDGYYDNLHRLALREIEKRMESGDLDGQTERLAALVDAFESFRFPALSPTSDSASVVEACARVADACRIDIEQNPHDFGPLDAGGIRAAEKVAAAIRRLALSKEGDAS